MKDCTSRRCFLVLFNGRVRGWLFALTGQVVFSLFLLCPACFCCHECVIFQDCWEGRGRKLSAESFLWLPSSNWTRIGCGANIIHGNRLCLWLWLQTCIFFKKRWSSMGISAHRSQTWRREPPVHWPRHRETSHVQISSGVHLGSAAGVRSLHPYIHPLMNTYDFHGSVCRNQSLHSCPLRVECCFFKPEAAAGDGNVTSSAETSQLILDGLLRN